jgi:hypothetical protein
MTAVGLVALIALVGCSKNKESDTESAAFTRSCSAASPAVGSPKNLPAKFPTPTEVTYTGAAAAGPSTIVTGYFSGDLDAAHKGYHDAFTGAGYTITHEEQDAADSEVNFSSSGTTGQVKLEQSCKGRVTVQITIRPPS